MPSVTFTADCFFLPSKNMSPCLWQPDNSYHPALNTSKQISFQPVFRIDTAHRASWYSVHSSWSEVVCLQPICWRRQSTSPTQLPAAGQAVCCQRRRRRRRRQGSCHRSPAHTTPDEMEHFRAASRCQAELWVIHREGVPPTAMWWQDGGLGVSLRPSGSFFNRWSSSEEILLCSCEL